MIYSVLFSYICNSWKQEISMSVSNFPVSNYIYMKFRSKELPMSPLKFTSFKEIIQGLIRTNWIIYVKMIPELKYITSAIRSHSFSQIIKHLIFIRYNRFHVRTPKNGVTKPSIPSSPLRKVLGLMVSNPFSIFTNFTSVFAIRSRASSAPSTV